MKACCGKKQIQKMTTNVITVIATLRRAFTYKNIKKKRENKTMARKRK